MDFPRLRLHRIPNPSPQNSAISVDDNMYRKRGIQNLWIPPSVYGGAGGHGIRISTPKHLVNYGNDLVRREVLFGNEKMTMQNLNDRLASYLEKVRFLEQSNTQLEAQIKQWYETNVPTTTRDYSAYYKEIEELKNQIKDARHQKARCILQVDNIKMAVADFRLKYETERELRLIVETDIQGLTKVIDDLTIHKTDLEVQIEALNKDLVFLKKEHQEEVDSLHKQLGNTVNVELKATPGMDLGAIMNEMRQKYEALAQENLQKAKEEFQTQTEIMQQQVTVNTEELKETEAQLMEQNRTYQNMEIDLKSQLSLKESLKQTLQNTKARYHSQLAAIQELIHSLEEQLMKTQAKAKSQEAEHSALLGIKTQLEKEIATYRRLLEGEDTTTTVYQLSSLEEREKKKTRKIKTVVEEVVDGKIVSSEVKEVEESM